MEESSGPINAVLKEKLDTCGIAIKEVYSLGPYTVKVSWTVSIKPVLTRTGSEKTIFSVVSPGHAKRG